MSDRSNIQLGALFWLNRWTADAYQFDAFSCDITTPKGVKEFILRSNLTIQQLESLGAEARGLGCTTRFSEKEIKLTQTQNFVGFRRVQPNWHQVDGTANRGFEDQSLRYSKGLNWKNNSCAIDCALLTAIYLDAWRTKVDQLLPATLNDHILPASVMRQIVHIPWGRLTQAQRNLVRDTFAQALTLSDGVSFPDGDPVSVSLILERCFQGLPQMSWTMGKMSTCCDGVDNIDGRTRRTHYVQFLFTDFAEQGTLSTMLNDYLQQRAERQVTERCSKGNDCIQYRHVKTHVVLDRLPPTLMLLVGDQHHPCTDRITKQRKVLHPLDVTYHLRLDTIGPEVYYPCCTIFHINGNHFVMRCRMKQPDANGNRIYHYDTAKSAEQRLVKDWWTGLPKGSSVVAVMYQIKRVEDGVEGVLGR